MKPKTPSVYFLFCCLPHGQPLVRSPGCNLHTGIKLVSTPCPPWCTSSLQSQSLIKASGKTQQFSGPLLSAEHVDDALLAAEQSSELSVRVGLRISPGVACHAWLSDPPHRPRTRAHGGWRRSCMDSTCIVPQALLVVPVPAAAPEEALSYMNHGKMVQDISKNKGPS